MGGLLQRTFLIAVYFFAGVVTANGQHCQYDYYKLIGIMPYFTDSNTLVDGLKITLVDSNGSPLHKIGVNNSSRKKKSEDLNIAYEFWRNPKPNKDQEHRNPDIKTRHFDFASNHYILAFSAGQGKAKNYFVKIEDIDGTSNGGPYMTQILSIPFYYPSSLCGYKQNSSSYNAYYQPLAIRMITLLNKPPNHSKADSNFRMYSKVEAGYKYELLLNAPALEIPQEKGSYAKRLRIYNLADNSLIHQQIIFGNELKETKMQRDSFELLHINFDGIPDVRFSQAQGVYIYFLSYKENDKSLSFYHERLLSTIFSYTREERNLLLKTHFTNGIYETYYTFKGIYLDTFIRFQQTIVRPIIADEHYFLNNKGILSPIPNPNHGAVKPKTKKEFEDYNFDGYEDFRVQQLQGPAEWNYYLFDSTNGSYSFDSLMSRLESVYFEAKAKVFFGTVTSQVDELTTQTDSYTMIDRRLSLSGRSICRHVFRHSERMDCEIFVVESGNLVFKELIQGAE